MQLLNTTYICKKVLMSTDVVQNKKKGFSQKLKDKLKLIAIT